MEMSRTEFDLAVIGGGPAGTAAAITAARLGARVVLFEAGEFPRQKVCGEFVSAESLEVLHDLVRDTPDARRVLAAAPAISEMRLWFRGHSIYAPVSPSALSVPRYDLDLLLWSTAGREGVVTLADTEVQAIEGGGPFRLFVDSWSCVCLGCRHRGRALVEVYPQSRGPTGAEVAWGEGALSRAPRRNRYGALLLRRRLLRRTARGAGVVNACTMVRSDYASTCRRCSLSIPRWPAARAAGNKLQMLLPRPRSFIGSPHRSREI